MPSSQSTCWTAIQAAAAGSRGEREFFARRYGPIVRAYLAARWRQSTAAADLEDAVKEVFVDCFKPDGVLQRADRARAGGFRPFLYGVVRLVALRVETRRGHEHGRQPESAMDLDALAASDESQGHLFDRAWAKALIREAAQLQADRAGESGGAAVRRVELLRLRFHEGLPVRDIAERWQVEPAALHHEYAKARQEFKAALLEVMSFHHPGTPAEVGQECADLLALWD
jgi:DNA-directed RNA polymerase specialized sigma24 family protein